MNDGPERFDMKTKKKNTTKLMKRSAGRCRNTARKGRLPYISDNTISRMTWDQKRDRSARLQGFNRQGVLIEHLGHVGQSGNGWIATSAQGDQKDFVKRVDAMAWVKSQASKVTHARNPKLWDQVKEAGKDIVHAVTKKKKSAAALKRLREAETKTPTPMNKFGLGKKRKNPEAEAAQVFEMFHGVPSKEVIEYRTRFHVHEHLAGLGRLTELVFFTPGAKPQKVTVVEEDLGDSMWLCASENGKQLYILGEIDVDLEELGYRPDVDIKDAVELGRLTNVVYRTQKQFHELEMLDYNHELGKREGWQKREGVGPEMNKAISECPMLAYFPLEKRLAVIGGQYLILPEGISN